MNLTTLDNYTLLGYDFRKPSDVPFTIDACLWEQDDDLYQRLVDTTCKENVAQLLDGPVSVIEENASSDTIAVAFAVSPDGFRMMESMFKGRFLERISTPNLLLSRGWQLCGFDVADINGYFSVFGIDSHAPKLNIGTKLFKNEKDAAALVESANKLYPTHSPFAVFSVLTYLPNRRQLSGAE